MGFILFMLNACVDLASFSVCRIPLNIFLMLVYASFYAYLERSLFLLQFWRITLPNIVISVGSNFLLGLEVNHSISSWP
jgi:hypothetical protein